MLNNKKKCIQNSIIFIVGLIIGFLICETLLKIIDTTSIIDNQELKQFRLNTLDLRRVFTLDPEFGFRPILGNESYNKYGAKVNKYNILKSPHKKRVLFIGDSVTAREKIIKYLRQYGGEREYEYWNAGVESFDTVQEVKYFEKFNVNINPDQVVLFFHNNDFDTTPVSFYNEDGKLVVFSPGTKVFYINRLLFQKSYLFRFLFSIYIHFRANYYSRGVNDQTIKEVRNSLAKLNEDLLRGHIKFTVVVLPIIDSYDKWSFNEKYSRSEVLKILRELNIRFIDLIPVIRENNNKNFKNLSENGDRWHPTYEMGLYFARYLFENNIFRGY